MNSSFIWRPDEHPWTRDSHVARFMRTRGLGSLAELRAASVQCHQWFWDEILRDMGLEWNRRYTHVRDDSGGFPWARWFIDGQINVTHNCIERHVRDGHGDDVALFCEADAGRNEDARRVTFAERAEQVNHCAAALRAAGVQRGDAVGLYAPMQAPTVVVMFATMKIGARFVPIFCGYGEAALRERLALCEAKILFACGTLIRRGKASDTGAIARAAAAKVPSITRTVWTDTADWPEFLETYFSRFRGVWHHGDWAMVDQDGQWFLCGRTDDTLKIAGKRVGPGEVEGALTSHAAVSEAAVIGVPDEIKGTALVCFVVLKTDAAPPGETELIAHVAHELGKPLAPKHVLVVPALPKTRSGKIVRATIRRAFLGQPPGDLSSVENPQALEAIAALAQPEPA